MMAVVANIPGRAAHRQTLASPRGPSQIQGQNCSLYEERTAGLEAPTP
jgi:hypothetical protein